MSRMKFSLIISLSIQILLVLVVSNVSASSGGVFHVQHKFASQERSLKAYREHDIQRHGRVLAGVEFPLGGDGKPTGTGLYYTKIGIGSPAKDYFVHVDTGSDIFWVNCAQCNKCPKKSGLAVPLTLYDPQTSSTGQLVDCDQKFCSDVNKGPVSGCLPNMVCAYGMSYGDGSTTAGYFVKDFIQFDKISGNRQTTSANSSVTFGCGVQQTGNLIDPSAALDGILGFGAANTSVLSQLASSGVVEKKFSHCLDGANGGGIFAIGSVVEPIVKTTPMVPNKPHYNVNMTSVDVGKTTLQIPSSIFTASGTIVDSGTTLSYLPDAIYEPLTDAILSSQPNLNVHTVEGVLQCFQFNRSVNDGFPTVTLHFEKALALMVYPNEYLFKYQNEWCMGWQNSGKLSREVDDMIILGDLVLSNKLVTYDIENQAIGWVNYNCSSTIKIKDESGSIFEVGSQDISYATRSSYLGNLTILLLVTFASIIY